MSEIWDTDVNGSISSGDEADWNEGSGPDSSTPERSRNKRKRQSVRLSAAPVEDEDVDYEQRSVPADDDEDDLVGMYIAAAKKQKTSINRQQAANDGDAVLLLDSDEDDDPLMAAPGGTAAAAGSGSVACSGVANATAMLSEQAQVQLERERRMREELEAVNRAGEEGDEDYDDSEDSERQGVIPPQPPPRGGAHVEDLTFDLDDVLGSDDLEQPQPAQPPATAADAGQDDKVALKFKTESRESKDDVIVRVRPNEPLSKAMASFCGYVSQQGWGTVSHFVSPDGDKLSGQETVDSLDLEAGDIIEVHLRH